MDPHIIIIQFLIPAIGLISGLIGAYVGLQNRALLAEVRKEIAEMEARIFERSMENTLGAANANYVKPSYTRSWRRLVKR